MKYPKFLPENGTIGFVAPSFGCNIEPYRSAFVNAQKKFGALGHRSELGPNCYEGKGIGISNTPQACGEELTEYYCNKSSDILISCGGGELMCETLNYLDLERIDAAEPKWFMGYSDNTNMTFLLTTFFDTASVYGPGAAAFGMEPWHQSLTDAYELLRGQKNEVSGYELWEKEGVRDEEHPFAPYHLTEKRLLRVFGTAKSDFILQGRLVGGCMDCLVNLLGTSFDTVDDFNAKYKKDGVIWFLESCDLNVAAIRRAIWQMKNAGWFSHVKGFLIGRPLVYGQEMFGLDQYRAVTDLLAEYDVPVLMDLDIGHLPPMMPIICGAKAEVSVRGNDVRIKYIRE